MRCATFSVRARARVRARANRASVYRSNGRTGYLIEANLARSPGSGPGAGSGPASNGKKGVCVLVG